MYDDICKLLFVLLNLLFSVNLSCLYFPQCQCLICQWSAFCDDTVSTNCSIILISNYFSTWYNHCIPVLMPSVVCHWCAGIQLRKVEERRQKSAQKQQQHVSSGTGRLDVQAIMEAAFEMRRKALEENDSEEDDDADGRWSDNDWLWNEPLCIIIVMYVYICSMRLE